RVTHLLEDDDARPLADHEAVPIPIEGARGGLRIVVPGGQGPHGGESPHAQGRDHALAAAGDHHVGVAALDDLEGVADGVRARGACRAGRLVRALRAVSDGDLPRGHVDDEADDEEGGDAPRPFAEQDGVLSLDRREPADPGADEHPHPVRLGRRHLERRILHGDFGSGHGVMDEQVHLLDVFFRDPVLRIEPLHLAGDAAGIVGGVEPGDRSDPGAPLDQPVPVGLVADPERRDHADPGDDDATFHARSVPAVRDQACVWMYLTASPTVWIFSASSSLISILKDSSRAITSSTVSRESAPRSLTKEASAVTSSGSTPSCSTMMAFTLSSMLCAILLSSPGPYPG